MLFSGRGQAAVVITADPRGMQVVGLANENGQVGKNLVFSSFGQSRAIFRISKRKSWPWLSDAAPFVNRSLQEFYAMEDDKFGFKKGGTLGFMLAHPNVIYAAVQLAKKGDGLVGRCPFHEDKTPSLVVTPVLSNLDDLSSGPGGDIDRVDYFLASPGDPSTPSATPARWPSGSARRCTWFTSCRRSSPRGPTPCSCR